MKKKTSIMLLALLLAVGFAAVSTTLVLTGNTGFAPDASEFDVIFTKAVVDGVEDNRVISQDGKSISYTTKELAIIDDTSVLDFVVTNNSTQYDAEVSIECVGGTNAGTYYTITKEVASEIPAQTEAEGKVTVTMIRSSVNEIEEEFTCTITANAKERETAAEVVPQGPKTLCNVAGDICWTDNDMDNTKSIGDVVSLGTKENSVEQFYILNADDTNIQMMSMYNLYVGGEYTGSWTAYESSSGIQDLTMLGYTSSTPYRGTTVFSSTSNVYEGSIVEGYVNAYSTYLSGTLGVENTATLISKEELDDLGCSSSGYTCTGASDFLYSTSYWTRSANSASSVWSVYSDGEFDSYGYSDVGGFGVRPVVTISASLV